MKNWVILPISLALVSGTLLAACTSSTTEHYVSPKIEGSNQQINLEAVEKAFWDTKGKDFNTWMGAFEKRVNEIYEGKDVVSIDATRNDNKLVVTGYINKVNKDGFQPGDEKLFAIEQTGEAVKDEMPYRVADGGGRTYYEGHHSILDNPILQMLLISHLMNGWGGGYYTPYRHVGYLQQNRDLYRATPQYEATKSSNSSFFSRFKTNSNGGLTSSNKFGSMGSSASTAPRRSLFGGGSSSSSSSSSGSMWGGRRSSSGLGSSSGGMFRSSRGWGGRRR